ncbi:MAG: class I SAM-dependent methyltransferase [Myxococcota bacterium]|nr:class I SAM-dependent methyltransferase [Myxococcota bacterium]
MHPNQLAWSQRDVVAAYATRKYITPAEVRILATCWSKIKEGVVLDLGVGTGRTTPYLAPFARRYVAIDYMPRMVAEAQRQHPGLDIRHADARALPFGDGEFSFVLFSFNGIDYVDPSERAGVLAEVGRVLAPEGVFAYSTHNLESRDAPLAGFSFERPHYRGDRPVRAAVAFARSIAKSARGYRNYRRLANQQRIDDDVAFINDGSHEYSLLTCYVTQAHERRALADAGFAIHAVIEPGGHLASESSRARDLYFVVENA